MARTRSAPPPVTPPARRPATKDVQKKPSKRTPKAAPPSEPRGRRGRRLAVVYDIEPPHVRLGILWFIIVMAGLALGTLTLALVYSVTAGLAAYQTARCWRLRKPNWPDPYLATAIAAALPLAAAISTGAIGVVLLAAVVGALVRAGAEAPASILATAGRTLQCSLWVGGAAAGVVATHRFEPWAAFALILAVSAYETGDYLIGSGARYALEGPVAGIAAVLVVQFTVAAVGLPPFEIDNGLAFGVLAAALCPAGQVVGSLVLPAAAAPAPALRRLDSLLLLGPVWAVAAGAVAATQS